MVKVVFHPDFRSGFDEETLKPINAKNLYNFLTARYIYFDYEQGKLVTRKTVKNTYWPDRLDFLIGQEVETGLDPDNYEDSDFAHYLGEKYGIEWYEDLSCGAEFPSKPYKIADFINFVKDFYDEFDDKLLLGPSKGAGGHMNISFRLWQAYVQPYYMALRSFLPWIVLTTNAKYTHRRRAKFRYMYRWVADDYKEIFQKYHWFHVKEYAIEFRTPDSLVHPKSTIAVALLLRAIAVSLVYSGKFPITVWNEELQHYYYNNVVVDGRREVDEKYYKLMTEMVKRLLDDHEYWLIKDWFNQTPREFIDELVEYAIDVGRIEFNDELEDMKVVNISWQNY